MCQHVVAYKVELQLAKSYNYYLQSNESILSLCNCLQGEPKAKRSL